MLIKNIMRSTYFAPAMALAFVGSLLSPQLGHADMHHEHNDDDGRVLFVNCEPTGTGLQDAINSAYSGDKIIIKGTCREAVQIIGKDLELIGKKGAAIEAPDTPWDFNPYTPFHPIILAANGRVVIKHLTINGRILADNEGYAGLIGVYFLNADGALIDSVVTGIRHAERQNDFYVAAVRILNTAIGPAELEVRPRKVAIIGNLIEDFESNGIFANTNDDQTNRAPLELYIKKNKILGAGAIPQNQNGIQILGFTSGLYSQVSGEVSENKIIGVFSTSPDFWSTGILVAPYYDNGNIIARPANFKYIDNTVLLSNIGMAIYSEGKSLIKGNLIKDGNEGMELQGSNFYLIHNKFVNLDLGIVSYGTNLDQWQIFKKNKFYNVDVPFTAVSLVDLKSKIIGGDGYGYFPTML
jgi:hypothetical protein